MNELESFGGALARGRAFLLLGQRHTEGATEQFAADVAASLGAPPEASLVDAYTSLNSVDSALRAARADALSAFSPALDEVANNAWEGVWTTAIDSAVANSFGRASGRARPVRVLFPKLGSQPPALRGAGTLNLVQLFGRADESGREELPPLSQADLQRRRLIDVPPLLARLPDLLAPGSIIAIAGVGADDWLPVSTLGLSLRDRVPDESVHWFQPHGASIDKEALSAYFGSTLVIHDTTINEALATLRSSSLSEDLAAARERTFDAADLEISVRRPDGRQEVIRLGFEARRKLGAAVQVLGDDVFRAPSQLTASESRQRLREFLRRPQHLPDWESVARGFLFERDVLEIAASKAEENLRNLRSARATSDTPAKGLAVVSSRIPLLLCGPPASGKTRLLHLLAYRLRQRGFCTVFLPGPAAAVSTFEPIGRACRVLQSAGCGPIAVLADDLDRREYARLSENLISAGISALIIGTSSTIPAVRASQQNGDLPNDAPPDVIAVEVPASMGQSETERLHAYLQAHGFVEPGQLDDRLGKPVFWLLLHTLLPDARGNIRRSYESEYERLMEELDDLITAADPGEHGSDSDWKRKLASVRDVLFPDAEETTDDGDQPVSRLSHDPLFSTVVNTCLFCSQLQKPAPLGLLLKAFGPDLVRRYAAFSNAIESTAVLAEVEVSLDGESALDTQHPLIAKLLLSALVPERTAQLETLRPLVEAVAWSNEAYPGEVPDQDYLLGVFQAIAHVSQRGREFSGPSTLETFVRLLRVPRELFGVTHPGLLLLEGNAWRLLADRDDADLDSCLASTERAVEALDLAEAVLSQRNPTASRNNSLNNVLTTKAAAVGYSVGAYLRAYRRATPDERTAYRETVLGALAEVDRLTSRARGLSGGSYYPSDVNFWNHKDVLEAMTDLSDAERLNIVSKLGSILEEASELPIDGSQVSKFRTRQIQLEEIEGHTAVGEAIAESMRKAGDYSGEVVLARSRAFLPGDVEVVSREAAEASLSRLEGLAPGVLRDSAALSLMNRLWMSLNLPRPRLGGEDPILAKCSRDQWARWRRILDARVALADGQDNPYFSFCLSWALFQLGESQEAASLLQANARISVGHRWRVGALAVLTDEGGEPVPYRGRVRRRDGVKLVVYVPALTAEIKVDPSLERDIPLEAKVGDELEFPVALNYYTLLPWFGSKGLAEGV